MVQFQYQEDSLQANTTDTLLMSDSAIVAVPMQQKSFFTSGDMKSNYIKPVEIERSSNDWITAHLIILLVLIAWTNFFYRKRLSQVFKSIVANHYFYQLIREGNVFKERISIPLFIVYIVSVSLFIYQLVVTFAPPSDLEIQGIKLFSAIILIVVLAWIVKNGFINLIGFIFKDFAGSTEILLLNFVFNLILGLIFLPIVIIAVYFHSTNILYAGIIFWLFLTLYRVARELFSGFSLSNHMLYYRFLYLCTLEILPLLILSKLIVRFLE